MAEFFKSLELSEVLEVIMVLSFGASWPLSIIKSYKARTAKGKSLFFLLLIIFGYAAGIASKIVSGNINYVTVFYVINFIVVSIDAALYFRNRKLDKAASNKKDI
ncbi:MAG: hypothetical protein PHD46_01275 [Eubacteriales bacterium]|nr:hypothetical protein [Eubacteriales bacterium]MDD4421646.1 hypothetical protein [Eubacteriales bacterium]HBR31420.1 hypothetical protein [Clostridiales bacterium]